MAESIQLLAQVCEKKIEQIDLEFIEEDLPQLLYSMQLGTNRICEIVLSLPKFSRVDRQHMKPAGIHEGIDSTAHPQKMANSLSGIYPRLAGEGAKTFPQ